MNFKPNLLAKIKGILPNWIVRIEFCQRCGVRQPICWHCDSDELWKQINGSDNGVLCPRCFWDLAWKKNIFIVFHAVDDFWRAGKGEVWQTTNHLTTNIDPIRAEIMWLESSRYFYLPAWQKVLEALADSPCILADAKRRMETARGNQILHFGVDLAGKGDYTVITLVPVTTETEKP